MIQIGHKIKKIVILVLIGDPFKPEVIRASANLFEKRTRNRMGKKKLSKSDLKKKIKNVGACPILTHLHLVNGKS